jgi:hypothetical protein
MTSLETFNIKLPANKLSFPLVTHMVNSDGQFGSYELLKSGQGAENILDRLITQANGQVLGHKNRKPCWGVNTDSEDHLLNFTTPTNTQVSDAHSHGYGHFGKSTCGVSGLLKNRVHERVEAFGTAMSSGKIMTFKLFIKLG